MRCGCRGSTPPASASTTRQPGQRVPDRVQRLLRHQPAAAAERDLPVAGLRADVRLRALPAPPRPMLTRLVPIGARRLSLLPWHALAVSVIPVLFLFAQNAAQQVTLAPLWVPLFVCLMIGVGPADRHRGDPGRWTRRPAGDAGAGAVLQLRPLWNIVGAPMDASRWLMATGYLLIGVDLGLLIWRGGRWVPSLNRFLNVVAVCCWHSTRCRWRTTPRRPRRRPSRSRPPPPWRWKTGGQAGHLLHHPGPVRERRHPVGDLPLRQRAVPARAGGARLLDCPSRLGELFQDRAVAVQLAEHELHRSERLGVD